MGMGAGSGRPRPGTSWSYTLVGLMLVALVAGCVDTGVGAAWFTAEATDPIVFLGFDYAGATAEPGQGTIRLRVDPEADEGSTVATFTHAGSSWHAEFSRFMQGLPFQEGGVRSRFQEHGATGNGQPYFPEIHSLNSGWGVGILTRDGAAADYRGSVDVTYVPGLSLQVVYTKVRIE